jgi:hypothetical protein
MPTELPTELPEGSSADSHAAAESIAKDRKKMRAAGIPDSPLPDPDSATHAEQPDSNEKARS